MLEMTDISPKFMIGQRVIYYDVICIVVPPNKGHPVKADEVWIDNPEKGYCHWVDIRNVKPLPNGQL